MINLEKFVQKSVLQHLTTKEQEYLSDIFIRFNGYPTLEQLWQLMDEPWVNLNCDSLNMDERVIAFYSHPVWMLNGLFIEQHEQSLKNRQAFTHWVTRNKPSRIADFGGGFGGLARLVGESLPNTEVEVVDPFPHPAAIAWAANTPNVRFVPELSGEYDMLIATDVFEHVPDPIDLAAKTASHLRIGGTYLIANCFQPVILCHLPQLFHLNIAWDQSMEAMGLEPGERVEYGTAYKRHVIEFDIVSAKRIGECGKRIYPLVKHLPRGQTKVGKMLMKYFC
jgi:hypothetical protein